MSMVFVGIDVSKDYSSAQGLDREGKKLFYLDFPTNGILGGQKGFWSRRAG